MDTLGRQHEDEKEASSTHTLGGMHQPLATALVPFNGLDMPSWRDERTGAVSVALRPIVEHLGLNWSVQRQRVQRDELYRDALTEGVIPSAQGPREMLGLDLQRLPMFLATINRQRVKTSLRPTLVAFQRECAAVLAAYWFPQLRQLETLDAARRRLQDEVRTLERQRHALSPITDSARGVLVRHVCAWLDTLPAPQRGVLHLMAQQETVHQYRGSTLALVAGVLWQLRDQLGDGETRGGLHRQGRRLLAGRRLLRQEWPRYAATLQDMASSLVALFHDWGYTLHGWPGKMRCTPR